MEIVLAESLGFCMGVKRAVDMAYRAIEKADGQQVVTLGPLIHNAQEIERLEKDGVKVADEDAIPDDSTVIIRAHGVTPEAMRSLKSRGVKVMDGTCPYVHYSQRKAVELREAGYAVVIGGRHSANSNKLVETARENCPRATLIETADEINPEDLRGVRRVGISAGASTPDWMIQSVVERLREIADSLNADWDSGIAD